MLNFSQRVQSRKRQWARGSWLLLGLGAGCRASSPAVPAPAARAAGAHRVATAQREFIDSVHQRRIPVRTYAPARGPTAGLKVALLNHGYGVKNSAYSFLARNLVAHGYLVVSVQQVLPTDAPLPTTGNPAETRRPAWERGVQSLRAVLRALPRAYPGLDLGHTLLVGHSFGGDVVMLFAQEYPAEAEQVISLDNCRMPLPRRAAQSGRAGGPRDARGAAARHPPRRHVRPRYQGPAAGN
ncbi:alpha/beta hydrolase [Hymenobacter sp. RP-2-7]|uniref:Alpha/beta hydrolase n=1 Tax=Hymenobacter polaris TaxID=2682546 RepID=A0A7Y0FLA2_9BACT|nr:alpha/beta hydrolase [Hymenobacter polaris]NML64171.1 alpha/beta hydrolase [Hymenobacter polaris]